MHHVVVRAAVCTLSLGLALGGIAPVVAQDTSSTPTVARTSWIGTPPPSDCIVEPARLDLIVTTLATPVSVSEITTFPIVVDTASELPDGAPATAGDVAGASETYWRAIACLNAGDTPRFAGYFSPDGIRHLIGSLYQAAGRAPGPFTAEELGQIDATLAPVFAVTPAPLASERQSRIDRIRDGRIIADGRIIIFVDGAGEESTVTYAVMRRVGEIWLIDAFGRVGGLPTATPSPAA